MRFIGAFATEVPDATPLGRHIAALASPGNPILDLPVEIFSYLVQLGDYHAPLGGFLILTAALLCMGMVERYIKEDRSPPGLLYGIIFSTVPLAFITNAWVAPLQALLIGCWVWYPLWRRKLRPDWRVPALVLGLTVTLCCPFLKSLMSHAAASNDGIKLVAWAERPSPWHWLMVFWPAVTLIILAASISGSGRLSRRWALCWTVLFIFAGLFYVDDIYSGRFNRFNTYLNWMPWIYNGTLLSLGPICLAQAPKLRRWAAAAVLVLVCSYGVTLGRYWRDTPKAFAGGMEGNGWLVSDPAQRAIIERLAALPQGVTLEFPENMAFARSPALTMAADQPSFIGWAGHEQLWRGNRYDIQKRYDDARLFYEGRLEESLNWLETNNIRYIVWLAAQNQDATAFARLSVVLGPSYFWHETYRAGEFRVGFWEKALPPWINTVN